MSKTGVDLLHKTTVNIKNNLGADYAFIGAVDVKKNSVKTISFCSETIEENLEYDPEHCPCRLVLEGKTSIFADDVQALFPKGKHFIDLGINGYIGVPLFSMDKKHVIGLVGTLFKNKIVDPNMCMNALDLLAPRVELKLDRVLLTQLLAEKKALFNAISTQTTEGITITDTEGNYLYVNQTFCKKSGYSERELLEMNIFDLKTISHDRKKTRHGTPLKVNLKRKDGTECLSEIISNIITLNDQQQVLETIRFVS